MRDLPDEPAERGDICPCGAGRSRERCCGRILAGAVAVTAEELMRSRYTAFAVGDADHLLRTWHPTTRPDGVRFVTDQRWVGLDVIGAGGGPFDEEGVVEFVASYERGGRPGELREVSRFVRHEGRWVYLGAIAAGVEGP